MRRRLVEFSGFSSFASFLFTECLPFVRKKYILGFLPLESVIVTEKCSANVIRGREKKKSGWVL